MKNDLITAATVQGEVTLSGTVSADASRQLAESIVKHVAGVAKVTNNLKVGNPQDAEAAVNDASAPQTDDDAQAQAPAQQPQYDNQQGQAQQQPAPSQQAQGSYNNAPPPPPNRPQYGQGYPPPPPPGMAPVIRHRRRDMAILTRSSSRQRLVMHRPRDRSPFRRHGAPAQDFRTA